MHGIMILHNGFEEIEALLTRDLLIRSQIRLTTLAFNNKIVRSKTGLLISADSIIDENKTYEEYDFIVLPGGNWVIDFVNKQSKPAYPFLLKLLQDFKQAKKGIFAICAAPILLDKANIMPSNFTCYPLCKEMIKTGNYLNVVFVQDNNFITANGPGASFEFALNIIKYYRGEAFSKKIANELQYHNEKKL